MVIVHVSSYIHNANTPKNRWFVERAEFRNFGSSAGTETNAAHHTDLERVTARSPILSAPYRPRASKASGRGAILTPIPQLTPNYINPTTDLRLH